MRRSRLSIEYIDTSLKLQSNAGVKYFGGAFTDFDKKNFRLYFRGMYGNGKLDGNLFPDRKDGWFPATSFDSIELRGGSHDMSMRGFYLSNLFTDQVLGEIGHMQAHGRMVHLYKNGVYHGVYHLRERWGASMAAAYLGGEKEEYESVNGNLNVGGWASPGTIYDGDGTAWARIQGLRSDYAAIQKYVDVEEYLDYMIVWMFGNSENEFRAVGPSREDGGGGFKFMLNDADGWLSVNASNAIFVWDGNSNNTGRAGTIPGRSSGDGPASLLSAWLSTGGADFKIRLADRIQKHLGPEGALSVTRNTARLTTMAAAFERPHLAESARWNKRTPANWAGARDVCLNSWIPGRTAAVLTDFRNAGLYPTTAAPVLTPASGLLGSGVPVAVSVAGSPAPSVYYTKDGTDPRLAGGALNPSASSLSAGAAISLDRPTRLKVRARSSGGEWSALTESFFIPAGGEALPVGSVVASEIHYASAGDGTDEFIELTNASSQAINLRGAVVSSGIDFEFSTWRDVILDAGQRLVLVDGDFPFRGKYGWSQPVAGSYRGDLSSGGERIVLKNAGGTTVMDFTWSSTWVPEANGTGNSLILLPPYSGANLSAAAAWTSSPAAGGNPNSTDVERYSGENPDGVSWPGGLTNFGRHAIAGQGPLRLPVIEVTPQGIRFTAWSNALAADADVVVESSTGLGGWQNLTGATLVESTVVAGIRKSVWTLPPGTPTRFLRLKATSR